MTDLTRCVRRSVALLAAVLLTGAGPAVALGSAGDLPVERITTSGYPTVEAIVVAPPELAGTAISQDSFTVSEQGAVRPVTVEAMPVGDLAVVLVIDTSGSMKGEGILAARRAAESFVSAMPVDARIAVVGFGSVPTVYASFTTDHSKLLSALSSLRVKGATALHDALITSAGLFGGDPPAAGARRVVVLLTDGGDSASKATLADAVRVLNASQLSLSAIAMATRQSDTAALTLLTSSVRGALAPAADSGALKAVFDGIANSVLRQYRLRWTSVARGATDVTIGLLAGGTTWSAVRSAVYPSPPSPVTVGPNVPQPIPPPVSYTAIAADSGHRWLYGGLAGGFLAFVLAIGVLLWPNPPKRRLANEYTARVRNDISGFGKGVIRATREYFRRHGRGQRLSALLEQAGMSMDAPTAAVIAGGIAFCGFALGIALGSVLAAIALGFTGLAVCYFLVKSRADRRSAKFRDQFDSTLQIIINSLRSGYGVSQAIATVARESDAPTSEEFRRIVGETTLGMDQIRSLDSCAQRTRCDELLWVTESMEVNRDVGGNLTEVLAGIASTIRSRIRLARQVHTLSAEGRISARILIVMPFVALAIQVLFNRSSLRELFHGAGLIFLLAGIVFMLFGYVWTKRIVRITY